jgi:hypothetical protein
LNPTTDINVDVSNDEESEVIAFRILVGSSRKNGQLYKLDDSDEWINPRDLTQAPSVTEEEIVEIGKTIHVEGRRLGLVVPARVTDSGFYVDISLDYRVWHRCLKLAGHHARVRVESILNKAGTGHYSLIRHIEWVKFDPETNTFVTRDGLPTYSET